MRGWDEGQKRRVKREEVLEREGLRKTKGLGPLDVKCVNKCNPVLTNWVVIVVTYGIKDLFGSAS